MTSVDAITLVGGEVRIESGAMLTIEAGGSLELRGTELTNDGQITVYGNMVITEGAILENKEEKTIDIEAGGTWN